MLETTIRIQKTGGMDTIICKSTPPIFGLLAMYTEYAVLIF